VSPVGVMKKSPWPMNGDEVRTVTGGGDVGAASAGAAETRPAGLQVRPVRERLAGEPRTAV